MALSEGADDVGTCQTAGNSIAGRAPVLHALDLRRVDPERLAAARDLAAALDGLEHDGTTLSAVVETNSPSPGCWIKGAAAVVLLDPTRAEPSLTPERSVALASAIDNLDVFWDVLERVLGQPVEFSSTTTLPPAHSVAVRVRWSGMDTGDLSVVALTPRPPAQSIAPSSSARLPVRIALDGPRLAIDAAATLAKGDLLILPAGPWRAWVEAPGRVGEQGLFDPRLGEWTMEVTLLDDAEQTVGATHNDAVRDFAVATTLTLPSVTLTVGELEALRPGSTLAIGPATTGLEVAVLVSGRRVAGGELVLLGDQYAVLVTSSGED